MNEYDRLLATWAKQNAETIYNHLETKVNPEHNWRQDNIIDVVTNLIDWPSEWKAADPYFEELQHILNDYEEDFGVSIPPKLIAYRLSLWAHSPVPVEHPLVRECAHWRSVCIGMDFDDSSEEDVTTVLKLARSIARGVTANNLPSEEEILEYFESPTIEGKLYTVSTDNGPLFLNITNQATAIMNNEGRIIIMDFDGNRLHGGKNTSRIKNYMVQGMKFSRPITDQGELASLVGNEVADLVLGTDTISIFDLPDAETD